MRDRESDELVQLGGELRLLIGRVARRLRQRHAVGELTMSEVSALGRLERDGPRSPGELAELERVRPQAMGSTLTVLERRGLVRRDTDPADGRRVGMSLTAAGRKVLRDRRSESVQRLAAVLAAEFTMTERRKLLAVLPLLDRLGDKL